MQIATVLGTESGSCALARFWLQGLAALHLWPLFGMLEEIGRTERGTLSSH